MDEDHRRPGAAGVGDVDRAVEVERSGQHGASYTRRARPGEARSHELPDTMQLLVQAAEHAVRIEARLGRPVIRLVVDAPEPILGIVVARDQRLDAPELVRLLLELLGAVDAPTR